MRRSFSRSGQFPINDNFSGAVTISGTQGTTNGTNARVTKETAEPNHAGNSGGASVWYNWTAPTNGYFIFDTIGSKFDTVLAVYTGTVVTNLTLVSSDNDSGGFHASQLFFNAASGTTYRIAVDGYRTQDDFVLNWKRPSAPVLTMSPASTNVVVSNNVTLTAIVVGNPAPTNQWRFNATNNLANATNSSYAITNAQSSQAGNYTFVAGNVGGSVTSEVAILTVQSTDAATNSLWAFTSNEFLMHVSGLTNHWGGRSEPPHVGAYKVR